MGFHHKKRAAVQAGLFDALRLMAVQAVVVVFITIAWGCYSFGAMSSALLGGLACLLPNAYFARRFFAAGHSNDPQRIVRAFYKGELLKLLMTAALILIAFLLLSILVLPFLTGFIGATLALWAAPRLSMLSREKKGVAL